MYYYIIDNKIKNYENEFDNSLYDYDRLDDEQSLFYEEHPTASLAEILSKTINQPYIPTLSDKKSQKVREITQSFNQAVLEGYYDETLNITILISEEDKNKFLQRITLINLIPEAYRPATTTITDINDNPHVVSLADFFGLMLRMGMYFDGYVWAHKVELEQAIKAATTKEELDLIVW